jgi:uncharacterized protein (DUF2336 family)
VTPVNAISKGAAANAPHVPSGKTVDASPAETSDAALVNTSRGGSSENSGAALVDTSGVGSSETAQAGADETSAKTAHVTAASACLCIRGNKAAGEHRACQDHYRSPSHDMLHWNGRNRPPRVLSDAGVSGENKCRRRDALEMGRPVCRLH